MSNYEIGRIRDMLNEMNREEAEAHRGDAAPENILPIEDEDWFEEWFRSDFYLKLYSHRDHEEAEACVDLILRSVGLHSTPEERLRGLDLACGPGRHAVALAERGVAVTAVDLSPTLLAYAESEAREAGADIRFIRSDMRAIAFENEFHLALQLFTSFGYFADRTDDALVLERVRAALRDGGYYALDLINERRLRETLVPQSLRHLDGLVVREERRIIDERVEKHIIIPGADGRLHEFVESVRLYSPETIEGMLYDAGLAPVHWFGDYEGNRFDPETSERMLVISRADR
jgi:SAM-dependent methyltransferase